MCLPSKVKRVKWRSCVKASVVVKIKVSYYNGSEYVTLYDENKGAYNKSMDVRAKQRLSYQLVFLTRSCVLAVSPHVISAVRQLSRCFSI
jgi:hypothetical protein